MFKSLRTIGFLSVQRLLLEFYIYFLRDIKAKGQQTDFQRSMIHPYVSYLLMTVTDRKKWQVARFIFCSRLRRYGLSWEERPGG